MPASAPESFRVSYPAPLLAGVLAWVCGWGALANITMRDSWRPRHGEYDAVAVVMMALMWGFGGLLGPVAVLKYSSSLNVAGERIVYRMWFGLRKRAFQRSDIETATVGRKGNRIVLTLGLADGQSIEVDYWARNFQRLLSYLGLELPIG